MYYAAVNSYATESSIGFSNTWGVIGFATRAMRDAYVRRATDLATKAIKSTEVSSYDGKLGRVSYYDASGCLQQYMGGGYSYGGEQIDPTTSAVIDSWRFHSA